MTVTSSPVLDYLFPDSPLMRNCITVSLLNLITDLNH